MVLYLNLKAGNPADAINPGHFYPITLVDGETGGAVYRSNIEDCNPAQITMPTTLDVEPGNMIGPTAQGMITVYNQDPDAIWSNTYNIDTGLWGEIAGAGCSPFCAHTDWPQSASAPRSPALRPANLRRRARGRPHRYFTDTLCGLLMRRRARVTSDDA